jgi:hypothetical protein
MEIREVRPEEYEEAGWVTGLAYEEFAPQAASPNRDYLNRVADVGGRAGHALVLGAFEVGVRWGRSPSSSRVGSPAATPVLR